MKKQYNHKQLRIIKLLKKIFFDGVTYPPRLKAYLSFKVIFRFGPRNKKKTLSEYPVTNDA